MDTLQVEFDARREFEAARAQMDKLRARQEALNDLLQAALKLHIAGFVAPWQALAEHIRSQQ